MKASKILKVTIRRSGNSGSKGTCDRAMLKRLHKLKTVPGLRKLASPPFRSFPDRAQEVT